MGFTTPRPPPFDLDEWRAKPYLGRLKANAQDWAVNGFGTPSAVYLLYVVKLVVFVVGAFALIAATTPGIGGLGDFSDWWTEPVVFQKLCVWTLLWEILGLGSGSMPLAFRFVPPIGGVLYWLRTGTIRLPPWPDSVPGTAGSRRTPLDVLLYAGVLAAALYLLIGGDEPVGGLAGGRLEPGAIAVLLVLWALLGLRDKVSFLAGRPEIYGLLLAVSLFGIENLIVGWQLVFICIWWGAASSKLNRHFPYVIAVMVSNTPWNRSRKMKAKLYESYPDDLRPSRYAELGAHLGTAVEFGLPLILLISNGGTIGTLAVIGMLLFHIHITSTFALGVPLEWNLFMIFGLLFLFGNYGDVPLSTLDDPLVLVLIAVAGVGLPVLGNLRPEKVSFLISMRYYAGNWATSTWMFRKSTGAERRLDECVEKVAAMPVEQVAQLYDREMAEYLMESGLAFRAMHSHGRALTGLLARAADEVDDYDVREGELISGAVTGWNFGEGHFHHLQLIEAIQQQCDFAPGDVRVVTLESQPAQMQRQRYRLYDAATGLIEEGWVDVAEMVKRGPWIDESWDFPVEVTSAVGEPREPAPSG
jgi:hypothetical protein